MTEPRSILVVSLRYLGDVLLTTPLIGSLRAAWPAAAIDALVFAGAEGALEGDPDVRRAIATERGEILGLWRKLGRRYDLAVIADTADRPHFSGWLAAPRRVGLLPPEASKRWWKAPLLERAVDSPEGQPRSLAYRKLAEALGIEWRPAMVAPTAHTPAGAWRELVGFDAAAERRFAVLHLAPRFRYKRWNTPGWHALIAWLRSQGLQGAVRGGRGRTSARTRARCSRACRSPSPTRPGACASRRPPTSCGARRSSSGRTRRRRTSRRRAAHRPWRYSDRPIRGFGGRFRLADSIDPTRK